jgi:3-oxoacyl-[acyl-carrier protein] reductase
MINPMNLDGRVVMVTGAGQGIGRAIAELAVELGGKVVAIDVKPDGVNELVAALGKDRAAAFVGSVADAGFVQQVVANSVKRFGAIHGLVNNAGIVRAAMIDKMSVATWQQVIDVNLSGVFLCLQAVGRHMIERRAAGDKAPARIVNISSDAGRRGTVGQINYGAAKSGVMGLTMSAAREWAAHDITVNTICFGVVETPMTETIRGEKFRDRYMAQIPMGRFSTPQEVAQPVCFLLSDAASYITGQHLSVNGGYTIGV